MSQNTYAELEQAVARDDREAVIAALAKLTDHEKDLIVDCPEKKCRAAERKECIGMAEEGKVHFGRRVTRLMEGIR